MNGKFMGAVVAMCATAVCGFAADDVRIETAKYVLTIGADAKAKSLKLKANGEEMLDVREGLPAFSVTQDRPFNNEIKLTFPNCETVFAADRIRREGDFLIVGYELVSYESKIRVTEKDGYAVFELVDFILGPKGTDRLAMTYPPVRSLRLLDLPVKDRANYGQWMNVLWDGTGSVAVMAAEPFTWIASEPRHGFRRMFAEARRGLKLRGVQAVLVADASESFLDDVDAMERDLGLPRGVKSRYLNEKGEYELCDIEMLPTPARAANLRGFLFERNGRRVIAYWHTCGSGMAKVALGAGGKTLALEANRLRYCETGLSKDEVVRAFAAAEMD